MTTKEIQHANQQAFLQFCNESVPELKTTHGNFQKCYRQLLADGVEPNHVVPAHAFGASFFKVRDQLEFKTPAPTVRNEQEREQALMEAGTFPSRRENHADKTEGPKPGGIREALTKLHNDLTRKPEPKPKAAPFRRLPIDATKDQMKKASPEQLKDLIRRQSSEPKTNAAEE
jgi:hypothetical protein